MLLYAHAVNDERDSRRALAVNSFWVSGSGALEAVSAAPQKSPVVIDTLSAPALQQDWQAWALAWQALDAREIAALLAELDSGNTSVRLSLCSEDRSMDLIPAPSGLWQSLVGLIRPPTLASVWKQL
jgi:hypothetical protein